MGAVYPATGTAVAKERLRGRLGVVSEEELAALEDGLRQIMQLG